MVFGAWIYLCHRNVWIQNGYQKVSHQNLITSAMYMICTSQQSIINFRWGTLQYRIYLCQTIESLSKVIFADSLPYRVHYYINGYGVSSDDHNSITVSPTVCTLHCNFLSQIPIHRIWSENTIGLSSCLSWTDHIINAGNGKEARKFHTIRVLYDICSIGRCIASNFWNLPGVNRLLYG